MFRTVSPNVLRPSAAFPRFRSCLRASDVVRVAGLPRAEGETQTA